MKLHDPDVEPDSPRGEEGVFQTDADSFYTMSTLSMENLTAGGSGGGGGGGEQSSVVDDSSTIITKDLYGTTATNTEPPPIKLTAEADLKDDKKRKPVIEMMRVFYKPVPAVDLNAPEGEEPERNVSDGGQASLLSPEIEMWDEVREGQGKKGRKVARKKGRKEGSCDCVF